MFFKIFCYCIFLNLIVIIAYAEPSQICQSNSPASKRWLNDHLFIQSTVVDFPFLNTNISTGLFAQSVITLDKTSKPYQEHQAYLGGLMYDLQIGILDWLAVSGTLSGGIVAGVGSDVIKLGAGGQFDYSLGPRFLLWQNKSFLFSSQINFLGKGYNGLNLLNFVTAVPSLQTNGAFEDCLYSNYPGKASCASIGKALNQYQYELGFSAEISMAMGINPTMGFFSHLGYRQLFRSKNNPLDLEGKVYGGAGMSLDITPITPVPLGFLLGAQYAYQLDNLPENEKAVEKFSDFGALKLHSGIFYTGSQNFSVGLEIWDVIVPVGFGEAADTEHTFSGNFSFRYYWN